MRALDRCTMVDKNIYYTICRNEDGISVENITAEELLSRLNSDFYGEKINFLDENSDFSYEEGLMIIRGECVKPKPIKVVKEWEL